MLANVRPPAVAGRFYPGDPGELERAVAGYMAEGSRPAEPARAVVVPHAGYAYSGAIAGQTFGSVRAPASAIVLCPNHTGLGPAVSVYDRGAWDLPGGALAVDGALAGLVREAARVSPDESAHRREHAIEVELPFLRALNQNVTIVPICLGQLTLSACERLGAAIAEALAASGRARETLLVASTDMSHYLDADAAREIDALAIARIAAFDPAGLYRVVTERRISMCGFIPTTVCLFAARAQEAASARLVRYGNSGAASGDFSRVVGYAGFVLG